MKPGISVLVALLSLAAVSQGQVSIEDLEGTWTGPIDLSFLLVLSERGVDSICRSSLTPECEKSLPPGTERVVIENGTISLSYGTLMGVNTTEQSAEMFPACAESGVFPFETMTPLPQSEIQSYDPTTAHLTFIDPRRPDDVNCVILNLNEGEDGEPSTISVQYVLSSTGSLTRNVEIGPSFRCIVANDLCISEVNDQGDLTAYLTVEFELPCREGPCLKAKGH